MIPPLVGGTVPADNLRRTLGDTECQPERQHVNVGALYDTDACTTVLDALIQLRSFPHGKSEMMGQRNLVFSDESDAIIRPLPRAKKTLSEPALLYQIVQFTYDLTIVQRIATLVNRFVPNEFTLAQSVYLTDVPLGRVLLHPHVQRVEPSAYCEVPPLHMRPKQALLINSRKPKVSLCEVGIVQCSRPCQRRRSATSWSGEIRGSIPW